jgi:hypothetical protein
MSMTTPPPRGVPQLPEILTDEHHEALRSSWELPAYEKPPPPAPEPAPAPARSHRTLIVGLISGALGLAIGTGFGYWAASERNAELGAGPPAVATAAPGYSATHDSRIIEPPQTISLGRWTRPVIVRTINPQ